MRMVAASILFAFCCGGDTMTAYPPDDHVLDPGTWGTDADLEEVTVGDITAFADAGGGQVTVTSAGHPILENFYVRIISANYSGEYVATNVGVNDFEITHADAGTEVGTWHSNQSGDTFVLFENTADAVFYYLDDDNAIDVEEGMPYGVTAVVQADSVAAARIVRIGIGWGDADGTYLSTDFVHEDVLPSVGVWHIISGVVIAPAGARGASPIFSKDAVAFHVGLDLLGLKAYPIAFEAYADAAWNANNGALMVVPFDVENYDHGDIYDDTNYYWQVPHNGRFTMNITVGLADLPNDKSMLVMLQRDAYPAYAGFTLWRMIGTTTGPGITVIATDISGVSASVGPAELSAGDRYRVVVVQQSGGNLVGLVSQGTVFSAIADE